MNQKQKNKLIIGALEKIVEDIKSGEVVPTSLLIINPPIRSINLSTNKIEYLEESNEMNYELNLIKTGK